MILYTKEQRLPAGHLRTSSSQFCKSGFTDKDPDPNFILIMDLDPEQIMYDQKWKNLRLRFLTFLGGIDAFMDSYPISPDP